MKGKLHVVETCGHRKWILCWGSKKEMMPYLESPISSVNTSNSTAVPQWRNLSTSLQQSHDNHTMITWQSSQTHHPTTIKQSCNDHTWQSHHCHMTHQVDHSLFHVKYNVHGSWRELVEKKDLVIRCVTGIERHGLTSSIGGSGDLLSWVATHWAKHRGEGLYSRYGNTHG